MKVQVSTEEVDDAQKTTNESSSSVATTTTSSCPASVAARHSKSLPPSSSSSTAVVMPPPPKLQQRQEATTKADSATSVCSSSSDDGGAARIKVAIRIRPLINADELDHGCSWKVMDQEQTVVQMATESSESSNASSTHTTCFDFDHVFGQQATTRQIYDAVGKGIAESVVDGINGTIFAYGQTSSGKSYTMQGERTVAATTTTTKSDDTSMLIQSEVEVTKGLIHMAAEDIFRLVGEKQRQDGQQRHYTVRVSLFEIYNEKVRDLLSAELDPERKNVVGSNGAADEKTDHLKKAKTNNNGEPFLDVREDADGRVFVADATEEHVATVDQLFSVLLRGQRARTYAPTILNEWSSRSHTIFQITVESRSIQNTSHDAKDDDDNNKGNSRTEDHDQERQDDDKRCDQQIDVDHRDDEATVTSSNSRKKTAHPGNPAKQQQQQQQQHRSVVATLNLVDLAGSERDERRKEGLMINKSLLALSKVILSLGSTNQQQEQCQSSFVNYRDSKLTRILQPSLSGNAQIAVVCCATPSELYTQETRSTLQFATCAKLVKTPPAINEVIEKETSINETSISNIPCESDQTVSSSGSGTQRLHKASLMKRKLVPSLTPIKNNSNKNPPGHRRCSTDGSGMLLSLRYTPPQHAFPSKDDLALLGSQSHVSLHDDIFIFIRQFFKSKESNKSSLNRPIRRSGDLVRQKAGLEDDIPRGSVKGLVKCGVALFSNTGHLSLDAEESVAVLAPVPPPPAVPLNVRLAMEDNREEKADKPEPELLKNVIGLFEQGSHPDKSTTTKHSTPPPVPLSVLLQMEEEKKQAKIREPLDTAPQKQQDEVPLDEVTQYEQTVEETTDVMADDMPTTEAQTPDAPLIREQSNASESSVTDPHAVKEREDEIKARWKNAENTTPEAKTTASALVIALSEKNESIKKMKSELKQERTAMDQSVKVSVALESALMGKLDELDQLSAQLEEEKAKREELEQYAAHLQLQKEDLLEHQEARLILGEKAHTLRQETLQIAAQLDLQVETQKKKKALIQGLTDMLKREKAARRAIEEELFAFRDNMFGNHHHVDDGTSAASESVAADNTGAIEVELRGVEFSPYDGVNGVVATKELLAGKNQVVEQTVSNTEEAEIQELCTNLEKERYDRLLAEEHLRSFEEELLDMQRELDYPHDIQPTVEEKLAPEEEQVVSVNVEDDLVGPTEDAAEDARDEAEKPSSSHQYSMVEDVQLLVQEGTRLLENKLSWLMERDQQQDREVAPEEPHRVLSLDDDRVSDLKGETMTLIRKTRSSTEGFEEPSLRVATEQSRPSAERRAVAAKPRNSNAVDAEEELAALDRMVQQATTEGVQTRMQKANQVLAKINQGLEALDNKYNNLHEQILAFECEMACDTEEIHNNHHKFHEKLQVLESEFASNLSKEKKEEVMAKKE